MQQPPTIVQPYKIDGNSHRLILCTEWSAFEDGPRVRTDRKQRSKFCVNDFLKLTRDLPSTVGSPQQDGSVSVSACERAVLMSEKDRESKSTYLMKSKQLLLPLVSVATILLLRISSARPD